MIKSTVCYCVKDVFAHMDVFFKKFMSKHLFLKSKRLRYVFQFVLQK